MSLAPSVAVSPRRFNPLPLYIGLFCLLWSFAFVAGKIGVTDCPPLILLTARFSLAGILILGVTALRGEAWSSLDLARRRHLRDPRRRQQRALSRPRLYRACRPVSAGARRPDRQSANPVFTAVLAASLSRLTHDLAQGDRAVTRHRRRQRPSSGTACRSARTGWHGIVFTLASLASIVAGTILFKLLAPKRQPVDRQRRAEILPRASC